MNNFIIFVVGLAVTLVTAMGILTSQVFLGYKQSRSYHKLPKIRRISP